MHTTSSEQQESPADQTRQQGTSIIAMSLSSLSSALGISSSDHGSGSHKRKESFRGEVFVSSFDNASVDGSSISSGSVKSNLQEVALSTLLGEPDSATATGSSSGFLSLAVSGSSLSSNQSAPILTLTVSRASEALRELTNGIQQTPEIQREKEKPATPETEKPVNEPPPYRVVLENVEYVTSLPHASSCTDLSTMDEPITKELAKDVFSRRIVPMEIPVANNNASDISTLYGGKHQASVEAAEEFEDESDVIIDVENGQPETATVVAAQVQVSFPWHQRYLGQRSKTELFFISVIGVSSTILIVLLVIVLR